MISCIVATKMSKKKKQSESVDKQLADVMCDNITSILLEMGLYPGTEQFDKMFYRLMDEIEDEVKLRVIKRIREVIDK